VRLDHLLSKEHQTPVPGPHGPCGGCGEYRPIARTFVSRWVAQGWNINEIGACRHGATRNQYSGHFVAAWNVPSRVGRVLAGGVWHTVGSWNNNGSCLFLVFPGRDCPLVPCGVPWWGCGRWWGWCVAGLLFENYIVNASIFLEEAISLRHE
jgi:hypothetical protein